MSELDGIIPCHCLLGAQRLDCRLCVGDRQSFEQKNGSGGNFTEKCGELGLSCVDESVFYSGGLCLGVILSERSAMNNNSINHTNSLRYNTQYIIHNFIILGSHRELKSLLHLLKVILRQEKERHRRKSQ